MGFRSTRGGSLQFTLIGTAVAAQDPTASAGWFVEHFGFQVGVDLGWYVNTQHPGHPTVSWTSSSISMVRVNRVEVEQRLSDRIDLLGGHLGKAHVPHYAAVRNSDGLIATHTAAPEMVRRLIYGLTGLWVAALEARRGTCPCRRSPSSIG